MQIVSVLCGVGEAVKGKNEKWLTGARNAHARDGALHPAEKATRPPNEKSAGEQRENRGAETENAQLFDLMRRGGNKGHGARRTTARRCKKKRVGGGGIAEDFVTLPRKRDTPPERRRPSVPPPRPPTRCDEKSSPLACVTLKRP